ncbi:MAG TPA: tetratricopeptide repeat protein [Ktedonobacteraceae bacterium]|nr:tetratricopeptide repeat protein [Ktedonobacteraceae bacterium]
MTRLLGSLPLALDQAGAYILETKCGFAEYGALFQTHRDHLLQRRIGERIPTDHPDSVTTTFRLNFEQVRQCDAAAADLLRLCAYLAPDAIAEEILTEGASFLGPTLSPVAADAFLLNQAIEEVRAFSLLRRDPKEKMLSLHRLVQAVLQDEMEEAEKQHRTKRLVCAINAVFPHVRHDEHHVWPQCERLLPHALLIGQSIERYQITDEQAGRLSFEVASYLRDRGRYAEAIRWYQQALWIREQQLGPGHADIAHPLNNLANLYQELGRYEDAEPLYQRALHICEQQLGPGHADVAHPLNNLVPPGRNS